MHMPWSQGSTEIHDLVEGSLVPLCFPYPRGVSAYMTSADTLSATESPVPSPPYLGYTPGAGVVSGTILDRLRCSPQTFHKGHG